MNTSELVSLIDKFGTPVVIILMLAYVIKWGAKKFDKKEQDHREERDTWMKTFEKNQDDNKQLTKDSINAQNNMSNSLDKMSDFFNRNMGK